VQSGARLGSCAANVIEPVASVSDQVQHQPVPANCKSANKQNTGSQPVDALASIVPAMSCKMTAPSAYKDGPLGDAGARRWWHVHSHRTSTASARWSSIGCPATCVHSNVGLQAVQTRTWWEVPNCWTEVGSRYVHWPEKEQKACLSCGERASTPVAVEDKCDPSDFGVGPGCIRIGHWHKIC
jgi:hypothetical protein